MLLSDLDFNYPPELVALKPVRPSRVLISQAGELDEGTKEDLLKLIGPKDLLVLNDTKVLPARVDEVLFVRQLNPQLWQVLFPARDVKAGGTVALPGGLELELVEKGLPQTVKVSKEIGSEYFNEFGELALPPYIQELRGRRTNLPEDREWYQTKWASQLGSTAAPTASLHFTVEDLAKVSTVKLTLHVGPGTFLPVKTSDVREHVMHEEFVDIPLETLEKIKDTKANGGRVWALGTTVARALESQVTKGMTALFIHPPFEFKTVDCLLTNFHQPRSTLLALVSAFAGRENVMSAYQWAIERKFRLFSYGDLSAWIK